MLKCLVLSVVEAACLCPAFGLLSPDLIGPHYQLTSYLASDWLLGLGPQLTG